MENSRARFRSEPWKWGKRVKILGLERAGGNMDAGWMFSGFCEGGAAGLCRGGSLWDCSLQFLLNYSSTGEQGQARSVCSTGNLTPIHTCKCNERKGKLEQILWGNPRLPHLIKHVGQLEQAVIVSDVNITSSICLSVLFRSVLAISEWFFLVCFTWLTISI